nr:MAG TPA: hypothetical protein [Bacteriophage sp.]
MVDCQLPKVDYFRYDVDFFLLLVYYRLKRAKEVLLWESVKI